MLKRALKEIKTIVGILIIEGNSWFGDNFYLALKIDTFPNINTSYLDEYLKIKFNIK